MLETENETDLPKTQFFQKVKNNFSPKIYVHNYLLSSSE